MSTFDKLAFCCLRWITVIVGSAFLYGCAPTIENRGYLLTVDVLTQIQPNTQTRDDVQAILGTPSIFSTFGMETWYYISSKEEKFAFYQPQEVERNVVAIRFNNEGVVKNVKIYSLKDSQLVKPVPRITPTTGGEMSLLQQLLGNIGRFNKSRQQED